AQAALLYSKRHSSRSGAPYRAPELIRFGSECSHQADLPTQEEVPAQDSRLSHAHEHAGRPAGAQGAAAQGPQAADAGSHTVTRAQRLTGRKRFHALRSGGVSARGAWVKVTAIHNGGAASRAGIAIRGSTSAVLRNRGRRRLRAALEPVLLQHRALDVVVTVSATDAATVAFTSLSDDLETAVTAAQGRAR